jgi:hypothetical protein
VFWPNEAPTFLFARVANGEDIISTRIANTRLIFVSQEHRYMSATQRTNREKIPPEIRPRMRNSVLSLFLFILTVINIMTCNCGFSTVTYRQIQHEKMFEIQYFNKSHFDIV